MFLECPKWLTTARTTKGVTVYAVIELHLIGLLEQTMLEMILKGRQRVGGSDTLRQTVSEVGSSNRESPTADSCRQWYTVSQCENC